MFTYIYMCSYKQASQSHVQVFERQEAAGRVRVPLALARAAPLEGEGGRGDAQAWLHIGPVLLQSPRHV